MAAGAGGTACHGVMKVQATGVAGHQVTSCWQCCVLQRPADMQTKLHTPLTHPATAAL